jgi:hypothetical protein
MTKELFQDNVYLIFEQPGGGGGAELEQAAITGSFKPIGGGISPN